MLAVGGVAGRPWCEHQPEEQAREDASGRGRGGSQSVPQVLESVRFVFPNFDYCMLVRVTSISDRLVTYVLGSLGSEQQ